MTSRAVHLDVAGVVVPVLVSTIVMLAGAFAVRKYAGPSMTAYTTATEGRLRVLSAERDEAMQQLAALRAEVDALHAKVYELERQVRELTAENLELRRVLPTMGPAGPTGPRGQQGRRGPSGA